jgi:hypothetical protein
MRNILDGQQKIDIIIDNKMIGNNNNIMIGGSCQNLTIISRNNLFDLLKKNQDYLDKQKKKILQREVRK